MLRHLSVLFLLAFVLNLSAYAQEISFTPTVPEIVATADLDIYNLYFIDIHNESNDSLYLSWRLIENSMPTEWTYSLCDYNQCYGLIPNNGHMWPIVDTIDAFLKLDVNPNNVAGNGKLVFRVYETGFPDTYKVVSFDISAGTTSTTAITENNLSLYPNPASTELTITLPEAYHGRAIIYNTFGQAVQYADLSLQTTHQLQIADLPPGNYWIRLDGDAARRAAAFTIVR